jgi:hypothetical protein
MLLAQPAAAKCCKSISEPSSKIENWPEKRFKWTEIVPPCPKSALSPKLRSALAQLGLI